MLIILHVLYPEALVQPVNTHIPYSTRLAKIQPVDHPLAVVFEDEVGGVIGVALGGVDLVNMYAPVAQELGGLGLAQADALCRQKLVVCPEGKAADAALAEIAVSSGQTTSFWRQSAYA